MRNINSWHHRSTSLYHNLKHAAWMADHGSFNAFGNIGTQENEWDNKEKRGFNRTGLMDVPPHSPVRFYLILKWETIGNNKHGSVCYWSSRIPLRFKFQKLLGKAVIFEELREQFKSYFGVKPKPQKTSLVLQNESTIVQMDIKRSYGLKKSEVSLHI